MDYAKRILGNMGWKEGEGLGKNSNGIAQPLKASLKFDNAGLGADAAQEFNNHWWERVFNEAASNVEVKSSKHGVVTMDLKDKNNSVEITTKGYSLKKLQKARDKDSKIGKSNYGNFLQSATLTENGGEVANASAICVDEISVTKFKQLTDDELFQACGGRTAHKGARHGHKMSGKLARLAQQEQELLAKMQAKVNQNDAAKMSKKKRKKVSEEIATVFDIPEKSRKEISINQVNEQNPDVESRKKKKKKNHIDQNDSSQITCTETCQNILVKRKTKKKIREQ